ncbi:MAG TPA: hypothetical protein VGM67_15660 [Gemmatimonadaceae bacterium]|jgi:hypothetical protein
MHLVHCDIPQEPLETAPRSALLADLIAGESWDGFWSSDTYYARLTTADGDVQWFEVVDDEAAATSAASAESRVLTLRAKTRPQQSRVAVVVAKSPNGRRMLVGGSARRSAR